MRVSVLKMNERALARGAALLLISGLAAGCSSQMARFNGVDDVFTASTPNQQQIIKHDAQPYPGESVAAAPAAVSNGPIARNDLPPVSSQPIVAEAQPAASVAETRNLDVAPTGTIAQPKELAKPAKVAKPEPAPAARPIQATAETDPEGWSRAGGTQVTAKEGETVYNLSRRFGVPANVIMKVNGLNSESSLQAGQKLVIPTYVYTSKAPVSSPDSDPNVAEAKSSRGTKYDVPADKVPLPSNAPADKVAVLPKSPKVKEPAAVPFADASTGDKAKAKVAEAKQPAAEAKVAASDAKAAAAPGSYKVEDGDSLSRIARKTGVTVAALKAANGLSDGNIRIGQTLKVPAAGTVVASAKPAKVDPVVTGAAGPAAKATPSETVAGYTPPKKADKEIEQAADEDKEEAPDATGIGRMRWPVRGRVISAYGNGGGKTNDGIDIAVPEGTPVKAAENGVVIYAGDGLKEFGNTVLVRHENGLVTVYGHASSLEVSRGDKVKRGQEIARSGMSGTTDAPKLHFEVRKNSAPVDPSTYLQ
jgi:murein DD-endopeptidase MepM/ murein hydrolase activator NlpD